MAAKEFPLSVVIRGIDRVTAPLKSVQGAIERVGAVATRVSTKVRAIGERGGLPVLSAAAGRVGTALGNLGRQVAWITAGITALGGAAVAAAVSIVKSFADAGGHLNDLTGQLGVNVETFQEWTYAAKLNGVEQDQLAQGIRVLNKNIGEASKAGSEQGKVFQALGIKVRDAKGHLKSAEQIVPELADKLQKIREPAMRAAVAQALLGKAGQQLIPMLQDGSKGLAENATKARALGLVLSQESVDAADKFGDTLDTLHMAIGGVKNRIGAALVPVLQKLADKLIDLAEKYGPQISAWAQDFAAHLPERLEQIKNLFIELWEKIKPLVKGIGWMTEHFGAVQLILGTVAVAIAATVIPAVIALTTAVYTLGVALLTTPIGWILTGLAAIAAAAMFVYRNWEPISRWLGDHLFAPFFDALKVVKNWFFKTWDSITGAFTNAIEFMVNAWDQYNPVALIRSGIEGLMGWLTNWNLGEVIRDKVAAIASYLPAWLQKKLGISDIAAGQAAGAAPVGAQQVGQAGGAPGQNGEVRVKVDLTNLPKGARVSTEQRGNADFELNQGYAMVGA